MAILTGHEEFFSLDAGVLKGLMEQERSMIVDGRNVVYADGFINAEFVYKVIGRGIGMSIRYDEETPGV